ncbi:RagB/SusD family nutrient uptake outer membrane protein, partial [Bacteroides ovatus]
IDRSASTDAWGNKWQFTEVAKDRSFIDSLNIRLGIGYGSAKERQKTLPFRQGYDGGILGAVPHFDFYLENQPWYKSAFGYNNWKYYCTYLSMGSQRNEETDMPLFRVEEVMLNYAEAMCELGEFDQSVADRTVNKLRSRANVAPMKVAEINDSFDPKRDLGNPAYPGDYAVNPLLWEIRRERRIELFSEGFRFDDLRRWKKCHYALKKKL